MSRPPSLGWWSVRLAIAPMALLFLTAVVMASILTGHFAVIPPRQLIAPTVAAFLGLGFTRLGVTATYVIAVLIVLPMLIPLRILPLVGRWVSRAVRQGPPQAWRSVPTPSARRLSRERLAVVGLAALLLVGNVSCGRVGADRGIGRPVDIPSIVPSPVYAPAQGIPSAWFPGWWTSPDTGWMVSGAKGNSTLAVTNDSGGHWTTAVSGLFSGKAQDLSVVDDRHAYLTRLMPGANAATTDLWATEDGIHWQKREMPPGSQSVFGFDFVSAAKGWMLVQANGSLVPSLWRTNDGGRTWSSVPATGLETRIQIGGLRFQDQDVGIVSGLELVGRGAVGSSGRPVLYRTTDAGATWTRIDLSAPADVTYPAGIDYVDEVRQLDSGELAVDAPLYVGGPASGTKFPPQRLTVWTSTDGGMTWSRPVEAPSSTAQFAAYGRDHWWAAGRDGVFASTDGGATWSGPFGPPHQIGEVDFVSPTTGYGLSSPLGYGGVGGSLVKSTDGGITWTPVGGA